MPAARHRLALALALLLASAWLGAQTPAPGEPAAAGEAEQPLTGGNCVASVDRLLAAGLVDRDPRVIGRALEAARDCRYLPAARRAADRLLELDGENVEALRLVGLVALETWQLELAARIYRELLAKPDVEPERALAELLPEIAEGNAVVAGWLVFKEIILPQTAAPRSLSLLARLACAADDAGACLALIDAARTRDGGNEARTIRLAAAAAAARGDAERALAEADLVAQGDPENHRFARIETLLALDRLDEAQAALLAIESDPTPGNSRVALDADRRLALLAMSRGDVAEAERRFAARLARDRGAAEALYYLALIAERRARKDVALQGYRQLIRAGVGLPPRSRAARLLLERGERDERDEALKFFDELIEGGRSEVIEVELARSRTLFDAGFAAEAMASLEAALARHPEHPNLLYHRAVLLDAAGRTGEGVRTFEALLAQRPGDGNVLNALGYTLADRKQQLARAERLIREALAQQPDNAAYIDSLAWVRYRRGDRKAALPLLERAWRGSREPEIAAHWGEVLWVSGDRGQARLVWLRGLAIAPDSKPLRSTIERFAGSVERFQAATP